jgi:hypothetical protein
MKMFLITLFVFLFFTSYSQVPRQYQSDVNRVLNRQSTDFMFRNMNRLGNYQGYSPQKYTITILLRDSTVKKVRTYFEYDQQKKSSFISIKNRKLPKSDSNRTDRIYPTETLKITAILNETLDTLSTGFINDTAWLFKVISGKITVFSFEPETDISIMQVAAIQVENGPIEEFNIQRLEAFLKENEKAMKEFRKMKYAKAIDIYNKR